MCQILVLLIFGDLFEFIRGLQWRRNHGERISLVDVLASIISSLVGGSVRENFVAD